MLIMNNCHQDSYLKICALIKTELFSKTPSQPHQNKSYPRPRAQKRSCVRSRDQEIYALATLEKHRALRKHLVKSVTDRWQNYTLSRSNIIDNQLSTKSQFKLYTFCCFYNVQRSDQRPSSKSRSVRILTPEKCGLVSNSVSTRPLHSSKQYYWKSLQ